MEIIPLADKKKFVTELAELHHAEWRHLSPTFSLEARVNAIAACAEPMGIPSIFIAISKGRLVGSAALVVNDMSSKPELSPWLAAVYVKENFRRQGIATQLISRCEDDALLSGVDELYLFTEFASQFYETLGWFHMERCEYRGVIVDVMCKKIAA